MSGFRGNPENTLGKYQLIAELGHGGMADVFLGVSQGMAGFNKLLVIKQLRPNLADDSEFLAMFLDEARLAARLSHRNVVQTYEVGEDAGRYFIAMEYLMGQSLRRIIHRCRSERFALSMHLRVISDALAGLHHAHELRDYEGAPLGVVHRDVSPHNVFVGYDGVVKVVDFGIAKALDSSTQTSVGVMKGKLAYMAPEQARGDPVDRRADVFAAGILLWEAIAGKRMWEGETAPSVTDRLMAGDVPRLVEHAGRFQTAAEFRDALEAFLASHGPPVTPEALGGRVSDLFSDDRILMQAIVERQLKRLRSGGMTEGSLPSVSRATSFIGPALRLGEATPSTSGSRSSTEVAGSTMERPQGGAPDAARSASTPRWANMAWLAAALAAGVFIGGMALWARVGPFAHLDPSAAPAVASAAAPATGSSPLRLREILLEIRVDPPHAVLFVDDRRLDANPFHGIFQADDGLHIIRAEAPGFVSRQHTITFATNAHIEFGLERDRTSASPASASANTTVPQPPVARPPSTRPPTASTGKRPLDHEDPWIR